MELGYLGPIGSYSYTAAINYNSRATLVGMKTFREIIRAVEEGKIERGILPIENSIEGAVTQVMDNLMETHLAKIQDEIILRVQHNLFSVGESINDLKYVYSHPQALDQCREFFARELPDVILTPCESTSNACRIVSEKGKEYGAVGNTLAGEQNGLNVLCKNIQDSSNNQTRFVVIGRGETLSTGNDKTSIMFSFYNDFPGSLYSILKEFADEKINLSRIESRPAKTEIGRYTFYVDFNGHQDDPKCKKVLERIEISLQKLKIFGSYPIGSIY